MLAITSTLKFGELPGNMPLKKDEANMPAKCVINVAQIQSADRTSLIEKIGTLSHARYQEVAAGLKLVWDLSD